MNRYIVFDVSSFTYLKPSTFLKRNPKLSLLDKYDYCYQYSRCEYGKRTVLLWRLGAFYEFYGVDNNEERKMRYVREMCVLLSIHLIYRINSNLITAGFPVAQSQRYIDVLIKNNYVVVVVNENPKSEPSIIIHSKK